MIEALVAGSLAGAMMGLASQAYWLILISYRAPGLLKREGDTSTLTSLFVFAGLMAVMLWIAFGAIVGLIVSAVLPEGANSIPFPSPALFLFVLFVATFALIPALVLMRTWMRHVFITYLLFTGLFGLLLPNLVVAAQK